MAPASMACIALCLIFAPGASSPGISGKKLTVTEGENVTLNCFTSEQIDDIRDITVEWKRNGSFVLLFRDIKYDRTQQDQSFQDRVELADHKLKNGNLSLILRKAQLNDSGVYECYFFKASSRKKRAVTEERPLTTITLEVKEKLSGNGTATGREETGGSARTGLIIMAVVAFLGLFVVYFLYYVFSNPSNSESSVYAPVDSDHPLPQHLEKKRPLLPSIIMENVKSLSNIINELAGLTQHQQECEEQRPSIHGNLENVMISG